MTQKNPPPAKLNAPGWEYLEHDQYDEAIRFFDDVLRRDQFNEGALQGKVAALRKKGMVDSASFAQAHALLSKALAHHPQSLGLLCERGWLYFEQKLYRQAVGAFIHANYVAGIELAVRDVRGKQRYTDVHEMIAMALTRFPDSIPLLTEQAWLTFDQRRYDEALRRFDEILGRVVPKEYREAALHGKIAALRLQGKVQEAEILLKQAMKDFPDSVAIASEQGWLFFNPNDLEKAAVIFTDLCARFPESISVKLSYVEVLRWLNRTVEGLEILEDLAERHPDDQYVREKLGLLFIREHDLVRAEKEFGSLLKKDSNNTFGLNGLGLVFYSQGLYAQAEEHFQKLLEIEPNNPVFHTNLARVLLQPGPHRDLESAEWHCQAALKLDPRHGSALSCAGVVSFHQGNLPRSEDYLRRSIDINPLEGSYSDLGSLYLHMGRYTEAEIILKQAIQRNNRDAQPHVELGNVYLQTGSLKEAVREFRHALALDRGNADAPQALAVALMQQGAFDEAESTLRQALQRFCGPRGLHLHVTLARLLAEIGEKADDPFYYEAALKEINAAIRLNPKAPHPYFYRGIIRSKLGIVAASVRDFQRCLAEDPENYLADRYITLLRSQIHEERRRERGGVLSGGVLVTLAAAHLVALWYFYLVGDKVPQEVIIVLVPVLLALIAIGLLVPRLIRFKIPGFEAELKPPRENISPGPKGQLGFESLATSTNSGLR